jgi:hypothetical protein
VQTPPFKDESKKSKYRWLVAAAIFVALVLLVPSFARLYIEHRYPFVHIDSASYCAGGFKFRGVHINKDAPAVHVWVKQVTVYVISKRVVGNGGYVFVTLPSSDNHQSKGSTASLKDWSVDMSGLDANVIRGDAQAKLHGLVYKKTATKDEATFHDGHVDYGKHSFDIQKARVPRDLSSFDAEKLTTRVPLPFKIPRATSTDDLVTVENVHVDVAAHKVTAGIVSYNIFSGNEIELTADREAGKVAVAAKTLAVTHRWLAEPATFHEVVIAFDYKTKKAEVFLGHSRLRLDIDLVNESLTGSGQCSDWIHGLPDPLPDALDKVARAYTGNMSIEIAVKPKPDFKLHENCSFKCSQSPIKDLFNPDGFTYTAYHPGRKPFERKVGPNQKDWVPISGIPPQLALAVTTLEDPGFQSHHGIIPAAIKNSLLANLQTGKFLRGGSTITMQLAKNIWLTREKTLLRKADEAMLVFALESCLTKEQILEFYLNVVQFGPDIYGIGPASQYYFHKLPSGLTINEAFYLAMILPRPEHAPLPENGGLAEAQGLMKKLTRNGFMVEGIADE